MGTGALSLLQSGWDIAMTMLSYLALRLSISRTIPIHPSVPLLACNGGPLLLHMFKFAQPCHAQLRCWSI